MNEYLDAGVDISVNVNVSVGHPQQMVFHHPHPPTAQSYFPRGPTEISFTQPGTVVAEGLSSPPAKERFCIFNLLK